MLYIASALAPTPVLFSLVIDDFTAEGTSSLITARPDRIEVWDITPEGLVQRGELGIWGNIAGIAKAAVKDAAPHILILTAPPNAHLLLATFDPSAAPHLVVTDSIDLLPPTPSLRLAEFFTGVISRDTSVIVSLWVGVLSCVEIDVEKDKDAKKRRTSNVGVAGSEGIRRLKFKTNFNINIREHNLLHLAFAPASAPSGEHVLTFLYQSSTSDLLLQARTLSASRAFADLSATVNVMVPRSTGVTLDDSTDFLDLPFSCPAARRVLPIPSPVGLRTFLVIGDEYSVLWQLSESLPPRPRRTSASSGPATSPRASNTRRSPQAEMTSSVGKRRKSSMTGSASETDQRWTLSPIWRVRQGFGTVLASTVFDAHADGASALFGDESGRLTRIVWESLHADPSFSPSAATTVVKTDLGICAPPSSLTPLGGPHLFLASACGDSAILRVPENSSLSDPASSFSSSPTRSTPRAIPGSARKGKGRLRIDDTDGVNVERVDEEDFSLEVRERWMNLAPVKDFCTVEEEGGGLSHLVVASGASCTNSLRAIRSGVGMETLLEASGLDGVERMWQIDRSEGPALLLSTASSTVLLHLHPSMEVAQLPAEIAQSPTLAASSLSGAMQLVTPQGVFSVASLGETTWSSWTCAKDRQIIAGQAAGPLIVLAVTGGEIVVLEARPTAVQQIVSYTAPAEIASLAIYAGENVPSPIIAIATWTKQILLCTLESLGSTDTPVTAISEQAFSPSLYLRRFNGPSAQTSSAQLLIGLSDGSMITYRLDQAAGGGLAVSDRKSSSLGTRPLQLRPVEGLKNGGDDIVAVGLSERMSIIFESRGRVEFSSVTKKDITAACAVNTPSLGACLVMASASGLSFVKITSLKRLHVQTLDLRNRSAAKVVTLPEARALAVGSSERELDRSTGDIRQTSFFELRDLTSFELLAEVKLQQREIVSSLSHVVLNGRPYVCVGIALLSEEDEGMDDLADQALISAQSGKVVLYEATPSGVGGMNLNAVAQVLTDGAVHDSKVIFGFLAVAAGSKVTLYRFDPRGAKLVMVSTFPSVFVAQSLFVASASKLHNDDRLIVGDGMRSVLSLEIDRDTGDINGDRRDMATHGIVAMQGIKDGGQAVVVADAHTNILTFRLQERPEQAALFGMHEDVARFAAGSLAPASSASELILPDVLFATVDGRIGIIGELTPSAAKTLDGLQRNMDKLHKGPGGIGWKVWRRGGRELAKTDTAGFIDGDFVQRFLDSDAVSEEAAKAILNGGSTPERVMKLNEAGEIEPATRGEVSRVLEGVGGLH